MKKLAHGFNTAAQDSNPGYLNRESEDLPLNHCTLQMKIVFVTYQFYLITNTYILQEVHTDTLNCVSIFILILL